MQFSYEVKLVQDTSELREGALVAANVDGTSTQPGIGRCVAIMDSSVRVQWLQGSYSTAWKTWKVRQGKKSCIWEDNIPKSCFFALF